MGLSGSPAIMAGTQLGCCTSGKKNVSVAGRQVLLKGGGLMSDSSAAGHIPVQLIQNLAVAVLDQYGPEGFALVKKAVMPVWPHPG